MMEFHISREARERYKVDTTLFSYTGNVVFADLAASRRLAHQINEVRGTASDPKQAVNAAALFAMGLIDEASHAMIARYRGTLDKNVIADAIEWITTRMGAERFEAMMQRFVEQFPGTDVYRGDVPVKEWLQGSTDGIANREAAFEEVMLLWMANVNPAFRPFQELFDDSKLAQTTMYAEMPAELPKYFATKPAMGVGGKTLLELLRGPALTSPDSLSGQLAYIREHWSFALGDAIRKLLLAADVLKEEELAIWMRFHPPSNATIEARRHPRGFTPGRGEVMEFGDTAQEYERFSADVEWMPNTVMIAKSTYVWLAQLSKWYGREIRRLDQIPDEELETLRRRGINALWLIGIWERSRASKTIKVLTGNHDAVASAYSLMNYGIAGDLGGENSYGNLRDRAMAKGIRLASDMVPNHMGIDSNWVIEHPEWFLSRRDSPYPAYRFEGPDLSSDERVEIKIEDHYFEQTDAAVVFRRRDKWTGDTLYIYHGNDGTSFPWNDTAQLNYLSATVREQVMQTILYVARLFPIIRFDAAMTLAKRHVERLWFPQPGHGGAIPSRAECSMTKAEFDAAMPHEFWREVVDRVAVEVPGTLLLAEAFWLMEGYFVRTLGMHRVYNSAFMVMLRDEDNANYRLVLKNTLEFDPDIMKRYVNFMSNPDERTAIDQFGTGDKYFGVASMMATLPGLPMLGHGQVEGFTEKYGMEYQRPRYDETANQWLVERHQREIAPLLHNRALFAESSNFLLYDFWKEDGTVDENVFAYSNRRGDQRAVIFYHNRYANTRGTIHRSAAYADKGAGTLRQQSIDEALGLPNDGGVILAYRNTSTGLEYLRRSSDVVARGISMDLGAYKYAVLLNWRELRDDAERPWSHLCDLLAGGGVPNLDDALANLHLRPVHDALRKLLDASVVSHLVDLGERGSTPDASDAQRRVQDNLGHEQEEVLHTIRARAAALLSEVRNSQQWKQLAVRGSAKEGVEAAPVQDGALLLSAFKERLTKYVTAAMRIPMLEACFASMWPAVARSVFPSLSPQRTSRGIWGPVLAWCIVEALAEAIDEGAAPQVAIEIFDQLRLREPLAESFVALGLEGEDGWRAAARIRVGFSNRTATEEADGGSDVLARATWEDADWRWLTGVHEAAGKVYLRREELEQSLWWVQLPSLIRYSIRNAPEKRICRALEAKVKGAMDAAESAGYDLDKLLAPDVKTGAVSSAQTAGVSTRGTPGKVAAEDEESSLKSEEGRGSAAGASGKEQSSASGQPSKTAKT